MVLEKLAVPELVKFPGFCGTPRLITMFPRARLLSLFSARSMRSRPRPHAVSWRFILILSSISHFGLTLPTGLVTDYGTMAMMLWTTFPAVPISSQWCTVPLFGPLEKYLPDNLFATGAYVKRADTSKTETLGTDFFSAGIQALVSKWNKCLNVNSDHVAVWRVPSDTFVSHTQQCHNRVLGVRVSSTLFFETPLLLQLAI